MLCAFTPYFNIWEAKKWGVNRPIWGKWLERAQEFPSLNQADFLACVSDQVKAQLENMGIPHHKILISPMAGDPEYFRQNRPVPEDVVPWINGKRVIGWIGSFRKFHGLDTVIDAFASVAEMYGDTILVLVGDGLERASLEEKVEELNLKHRVFFAGRKPYKQIPALIKVFDVAIVSADSKESFHYSPLKLREYLMAGIATIAPNAGEIPQVFEAGKHLLLYEPGEHQSLSQKIDLLLKNDTHRNSLASNGAAYAQKRCSWEFELNNLIDHLNK